MSGATEIIVVMWFLPVVVYFIIPLLTLCGYSLLRFVAPQRAAKSAAGERPGRYAQEATLPHA